MPTLIALLNGVGLPTSDLEGIAGLRTWVVESRGVISGAIALEPFGREALLRSLAVAPDHRHRGIGRALVAQLETEARTAGISRLVLLTQTAETFFRDLGYHPMDRRHMSDEVQRCAEFQALCPASALCMSKMLVKIDGAELANV